MRAPYAAARAKCNEMPALLRTSNARAPGPDRAPRKSWLECGSARTIAHVIRAALGILILIAACGDEPAPPPTAQPRVAKAAPKTKELKPRPRIEDRVRCATPTDAVRCDPAAPKCATGEYCLAAGTDHYCGPCPE